MKSKIEKILSVALILALMNLTLTLYLDLSRNRDLNVFDAISRIGRTYFWNFR